MAANWLPFFMLTWANLSHMLDKIRQEDAKINVRDKRYGLCLGRKVLILL